MALQLRQVVLVTADLEGTCTSLTEVLGLGEPFHDPGVAEFGVANAVYAIGDRFLEVLAPVEEGTAAGRQLERNGGDGGYMVLVQVDDTSAARRRAADLGVRTVWSADLDDISGTHLHPSDTGGTLLSFDTPVPEASWRWAGPAWRSRRATGATDIAGAAIATEDPVATASRWRSVLGGGLIDDTTLLLGESWIAFGPGPARGLVGVAVATDDPAGMRARAEAAGVPVTAADVTIGGVRFLLPTG